MREERVGGLRDLELIFEREREMVQSSDEREKCINEIDRY